MIVRILLAVLFAATALHAQHGNHGSAPKMGMRTPTVAFESGSRAWRVWTDDGQVLVAASADRGKTWGTATRVTREAETIDANGESRPKVAVGSKGEIYVSWTRSGTRPYTGDIRFARSLDGGKTFDAPRTINDDGLETGHRFDALAVAADGTVHLTWIDKRDLEAAKAAKKAYQGAALYHAVSRDRGATFAANRKLKDNICECCRIAHAFDRAGNLVLLWRDAAGNVRDHMLVRLGPDGTGGKPSAATSDGWKVNGCPHHGPAVAAGSDGTTHMAWFTGGGPRGVGAFYGRIGPDGRATNPEKLTANVAAHAVVAVQGKRVVVAWKEARAVGASIVVRESPDGGATFGPPRTVAQTAGMSDHPFLVSSPERVYLSWFAAVEGHRLMPL